MLQHSSIECSQRSLLSARRLPSPHNRACPPRNLPRHVYFEDGGRCHCRLEENGAIVACNTTQTKALPNLRCGGRLKGANIPGQSDSPCFLSVSQLRNDITNRSVTCAVSRKSSNHVLHTSSAFSQQQNVPPSNVQKKEHSTESNSAHADFFIKTPSTFLPARRVFGPQQWLVLSEERPFLKENATNQLVIAYRPNYKPRKKSRPYKIFLRSSPGFRSTQKEKNERQFVQFGRQYPSTRKNKRRRIVTVPSFRCVRRSYRVFLRFSTVSLFVLTLQPLHKYAEKIIWIYFSPNSPYC